MEATVIDTTRINVRRLRPVTFHWKTDNSLDMGLVAEEVAEVEPLITTRNDKGEIVNAIVISTFFSGDATAMYNSWYAGQSGNGFAGGALVGPGLMFDTNRFYVVFLDGLGLWGASKPSDGLARKFPVYSYYDMVQLNYRLLRDHLKIGQVVQATGVSMGGTQSYYWGLMYPDFVKAVLPIGGASATSWLRHIRGRGGLWGRVPRASRIGVSQTAWCCNKDEGRSLKIGVQALVLIHLKRLWSKPRS